MKCFLCQTEIEEREWADHFQVNHTKPPKEGAKRITEEMGVHKEWYEQARKVTQKTLGAFIRHLSEDFHHDYGTVCHAAAASALAGAFAFEHGPSGGLSGF